MEKTKSIIDKIKEKNIRQKPKWHFELRNIFIWGTFIVGVLIGAISFSIILFTIQQVDFSLVTHLSHSKLELFLGLLPFFWIIGLLIFLTVAIFAFQRSERGYKLTWFRLLGISMAFSILLGTLFFIAGGSQGLEMAFASKVSSYESIQQKKMKIWMKPEEGFLSGTIENVVGDTIYLIDFNNTKWNVDYGNAFIAPIVSLEKGEQVKLVGQMTQNNNFQAKDVRPWDGMKGQRKGQRKGKQ